MDFVQVIDLLMVLGAIVGVATMYLYVATAIEYRHRDNGLAYILFVLGVGVWNGMFATKFLVSDPIINQFFFSLSMIGALIAGLGWFLFAGTASSTPNLPARRPLFGVIAVLVGLSMTLAMTNPVHELYWQFEPASQSGGAGSIPAFGYWLHTALVTGLFVAGTVHFSAGWHDDSEAFYPQWYAILGGLTSVAVLGTNVFYAGELAVPALAAVLLTTVGWLQAKRWTGFQGLRTSLTQGV